jgi:single-stranded DNA-binding protein
MNPIHITVTGRLGDDPRTFTARDETGVELRLACDLPGRDGGEGPTRWVKVTAFGALARNTATSFGKGDRVTVIATDLTADVWNHKESGEARGTVALRGVIEISASTRFDTVTTGYSDRKAARAAAANGQPNDRPASEQGDLQVLRGITATS